MILALGLSVAVERFIHARGPRALRFVRMATPLTALLVLGLGIGIEATRQRSERATEVRLPVARAGAPNVLVIVIDTLRADHLSNYGYTRNTAPTIARLAARGVQFDQAFSAASWTLPSHVSMLTGHYPSSHGAELERYDNRFPTVGAAFMERGYRTAVVTGNTGVFTRAHGLGEGFVRFDDSFFSAADGFLRTQLGHDLLKWVLKPLGWGQPARRLAESVTRDAAAWVAQDPSRPFFLFLNYFDVHDPYTSDEPWRSQFSSKPSPGGRFDSTQSVLLADLTADQVHEEIDAYDGAISYVDHWIGELLASLERSGRLANTIVVLTSDHGEGLGQHGFMGHGTTLYAEQIHVPLIFSASGRIPAGVRIPGPVSHTSLPATLLELAGGEGVLRFPGEALTALWAGENRQPASTPAFSELRLRPWKLSQGDVMRALIDGNWHLIDHTSQGPELFDLLQDPKELANLATETHRDLVTHYRELIRATLDPPR